MSGFSGTVFERVNRSLAKTVGKKERKGKGKDSESDKSVEDNVELVVEDNSGDERLSG